MKKMFLIMVSVSIVSPAHAYTMPQRKKRSITRAARATNRPDTTATQENDPRMLVHRKGATRAFGPESPELPANYRSVGQPVLIPGTMGTASYVLVGTKEGMHTALGSSCHGAGRRMSRMKAKHSVRGTELRKHLEHKNIIVRCDSDAGLAEEAPSAYKDVDSVVNVVHQEGLAHKVARLVPLAVIKGG